jgi:uncharacterized damage-inducible protein DinB
MNPYASFVGENDPLQVIASTPGRLDAFFTTMGADRANEPPATGKWSPREVLCHLADTELAFAFRLRQALAEPLHVIQPFDQELWAKNWAYDTASALEVFRAVRNSNIALIRAAIPEALSKPVTHPERGAMTFQTLIETMAGHDVNHLRQIEAVAA